MEVLREAGEFLKDNAKKNLGTFKFQRQIKELSDTSVFNPDEIVWLRYNKDLIKKMYESKAASGMIYYLGKISNVFYIRAMARKLGTYDRNIRTWVNKLYKQGSKKSSLLAIHPQTNHIDGKEVYYQVSEDKINLFRGIYEGLIRYYAEKDGESLKDMVSHKQSKTEVSQRKYYWGMNKEDRRRYFY